MTDSRQIFYVKCIYIENMGNISFFPRDFYLCIVLTHNIQSSACHLLWHSKEQTFNITVLNF